MPIHFNHEMRAALLDSITDGGFMHTVRLYAGPRPERCSSPVITEPLRVPLVRHAKALAARMLLRWVDRMVGPVAADEYDPVRDRLNQLATIDRTPPHRHLCTLTAVGHLMSGVPVAAGFVTFGRAYDHRGECHIQFDADDLFTTGPAYVSPDRVVNLSIRLTVA